MPGGRVHHQARRLVDHQQMLVLVDHLQGHRLGQEGHGLGRGPELDLDRLAGAALVVALLWLGVYWALH